MERYLIIKNPETAKYFTSDYENYLSRNLSDAYTFQFETQVQSALNNWQNNDFRNPFEEIKYITIETIYQLK